jgi:hypothetical protein
LRQSAAAIMADLSAKTPALVCFATLFIAAMQKQRDKRMPLQAPTARFL